jgi:site-specific DNA-methyltransferase (adenine-specific)
MRLSAAIRVAGNSWVEEITTMTITVQQGDCLDVLRTLPGSSVDCVVTSPPYNLGKRYNQHDDNMPEAEYLAWQGQVAQALRWVLKPGGHVFLNIGWNSAHPWRSVDVLLAYRRHFQLQNTVAWIKSLALDASALPEDDLKTLPALRAWLEGAGLPVTGREGVALRKALCGALRADLHERTFGHMPSLNSDLFLNPGFEHVWHLTPAGRSPVDRDAIGVPYVHKDQPTRFGHGRDRHCPGSAWHIPYKTTQSREDRFHHPASYPVELVTTCLKLAGLAPGALVLDPFAGTGATLLAAQALGIDALGIEIDPTYCAATEERLRQAAAKEAA